MQTQLRELGATHLLPDDFKKFDEVHKTGKLIKPEDAGYFIATLALKGGKKLSGEFVGIEAPEMQEFRLPVGRWKPPSRSFRYAVLILPCALFVRDCSSTSFTFTRYPQTAVLQKRLPYSQTLSDRIFKDPYSHFISLEY